ncbi:MAG: type I-D CRISPR-associated protein Cas7/Csc2 [Chloroflexi bacterium]|nr:type I-D CRISPR-associated protein Cas7/Csc2 [Chloroflexota bacterium]
MNTDNAFAKVRPYLVERPRPLIGAETVQLLLMREILDYTVLRTEETRELNTVHTPLSAGKPDEPVRRVAFLATKQKAAESRELEHFLRTATDKAGLKYIRRNGSLLLTEQVQKGDEEVTCYLKDNLCMQCPRCGLYGGTSTVAGQQERANIKHRIEYSTAFSLLPFDDIGTALTFNAINDRNQTTGQALGQRFAVQPATLFPSVITLKSVTERELILAVKTLLACKSYGAESRIGGDARNSIWGIVAGWEEVITSLELTLELVDNLANPTPETVQQITKEKYKPMAGNPQHIIVLEVAEVEALVKACAETDLDKAFLEAAYQDIASYRAEQLTR